jgi:hypothetical protein
VVARVIFQSLNHGSVKLELSLRLLFLTSALTQCKRLAIALVIKVDLCTIFCVAYTDSGKQWVGFRLTDWLVDYPIR